MSIRESRIETPRLPAGARPVVARPATAIRRPGSSPGALAGPMPEAKLPPEPRGGRLAGPLSLFRTASPSPITGSSSSRDAVATGVERLEGIIERSIAVEADPDKAATLDLGRALLAEIGRRMLLLRAGAGAERS